MGPNPHRALFAETDYGNRFEEIPWSPVLRRSRFKEALTNPESFGAGPEVSEGCEAATLEIRISQRSLNRIVKAVIGCAPDSAPPELSLTPFA